MAVEDIGLADPQAQAVCLDAWQTYERLGEPGGRIGLSQCGGLYRFGAEIERGLCGL